jgi:hypothetical protein
MGDTGQVRIGSCEPLSSHGRSRILLRLATRLGSNKKGPRLRFAAEST